MICSDVSVSVIIGSCKLNNTNIFGSGFDEIWIKMHLFVTSAHNE